MKILKGIVYFLLIVVVILVVAALLAPGTKTVERSITIDAPAGQVYDAVADYNNWKNWDPWFGKDTAQHREPYGTAGEAGHGYKWHSESENVGVGLMETTAAEADRSIAYKLVFGEGDRTMEASGTWSLEEADGKTNVSWSMTSELGFPWKIFHYMTERRMAPDFEEGLAKLKEYVEAQEPVAASGVTIVSEFGTNFAILRELVKFEDMDAYFTKAYPALYEYARNNGVEPRGASKAFYYTWDDTANYESDMAAAIAISDPIIEEGEEVDIAVGKAMLYADHITYKQVGGYSQSGASHGALGQWLQENGKSMKGPVIEEYITGPNEQVDSTEYVTNIIYHFE